MKKLSLLFVCTLIAVSTIHGQSPKQSPASGILYKITGKDLKKPSYLFGTIHLICEKDMFPTEKLSALIDETGQIMLETDLLDTAAIKKAAAASKMPDGKTIREMLSPEEYAKIDEYFKKYLGLSYDDLGPVMPMFAMATVLSSPKMLGCQSTVVYDNFLAKTAVARKKKLVGLEKMDAQIAVVDSVPLDQQIKELKEAANDPEIDITEFKALTKAYLSQDSDELYDLISGEMKKAGYSQAKMLDDRNSRWIPVIEKNVATTPSFIAVGAGHLGGMHGVVNLLRAKGYTLTPMKL